MDKKSLPVREARPEEDDSAWFIPQYKGPTKMTVKAAKATGLIPEGFSKGDDEVVVFPGERR